MEKQRIQKVIAEAGAASRKSVERMILDGRITVNGDLVTELPCFVDPERDDIRIDNLPVAKRPSRRVYFLLNKPRSVVCDEGDSLGRPAAMALVPGLDKSVRCAGRLDAESSGLVILTNDGGLIERLTHASHAPRSTYVAEVDGHVEGQAMEMLKRGMHMDGRKAGTSRLKVLSRGPGRSLLELAVAETHNRQVRRMLARVGHKVRRLKRVAIGGITSRGLKVGRFRRLTEAEIASLRRGEFHPLGPSGRGDQHRRRKTK